MAIDTQAVERVLEKFKKLSKTKQDIENKIATTKALIERNQKSLEVFETTLKEKFGLTPDQLDAEIEKLTTELEQQVTTAEKAIEEAQNQ